MTSPLSVAIIGAGPAGIYAGNILAREAAAAGFEPRIDLFEGLPAPYDLIRYGVAPHQPRIKGCLLYTSPSPRDRQKSRMPSSA